MTTGKVTKFPSAKHEITVCITYVGVFIFIRGVSKTICTTPNPNAFKVIPAPKGFPNPYTR
jgi:hypothetical protein